MDSASPVLERLLAHDRKIVMGGLLLVALASWLYVVSGAGLGMKGAGPLEGASLAAGPTDWTPAYFLLLLLMWWVMMIAMMLPSAGPAVLIFAAVTQRSHPPSRACRPAWIFASGYLAAWGGFSLIATASQWGLERLALLSPMMQTTSVQLGAVLLIGAGIYQLTPLKQACLRHCRSPIHFIAAHWRPGPGGAFRMGFRHGLFCLGCCWVLMTLLFYGGVMNLLWIGGLALYVLIEKLAPFGHRVGRYAGGLLIPWGVWLLIA